MKKETEWRDPMVPNKIELPLDIAISDLKRYKKELPFNLYSLSGRQVTYLKRMLAIIEGLESPERIEEVDA